MSTLRIFNLSSWTVTNSSNDYDGPDSQRQSKQTISTYHPMPSQPFKVGTWWFQPVSKILVKLEYFPKDRGEKQTFELPPPSTYIPYFYVQLKNSIGIFPHFQDCIKFDQQKSKKTSPAWKRDTSCQRLPKDFRHQEMTSNAEFLEHLLDFLIFNITRFQGWEVSKNEWKWMEQ